MCNRRDGFFFFVSFLPAPHATRIIDEMLSIENSAQPNQIPALTHPLRQEINIQKGNVTSHGFVYFTNIELIKNKKRDEEKNGEIVTNIK